MKVTISGVTAVTLALIFLLYVILWTLLQQRQGSSSNQQHQDGLVA